MASELPDVIDCRQLVAGDGRLAGKMSRTRLERIEGPYRLVGDLEAELELRPRAAGGYTLSGRLTAPLEAQCQRCLEWMTWPLEATFEVLALERAPRPDEGEEDSVELDDGELPLREVLEDELLLSCPFAPTHADQACSGMGPARQAEPALGADRRRPFANLDQLLKGRDGE